MTQATPGKEERKWALHKESGWPLVCVKGFAQEEVSLKWFILMGSTQLKGELPDEGLGTPQEGCS